jgi:hypothetical protein
VCFHCEKEGRHHGHGLRRLQGHLFHVLFVGSLQQIARLLGGLVVVRWEVKGRLLCAVLQCLGSLKYCGAYESPPRLVWMKEIWIKLRKKPGRGAFQKQGGDLPDPLFMKLACVAPAAKPLRLDEQNEL